MRRQPPIEAESHPGPPGMKRRRRRRLISAIALAMSCGLVVTGMVAFFSFRQLDDSIVRSEFVLPQVEEAAAEPGEQNILIMGMDTRVDQNGDPLPEEVYQTLQAGNAEDGGYNANVLMLLHIPEDRSQTVGISIPRDDYVEIAGAPLGVTHSKIKEAYGLAMQQRLNELHEGDEEISDEEAYQQARAAGRQTQIETVSQFLGNVGIDHFVEMSMGGFYHIAEAVAPITVCLNQATEDRYSGANFSAGLQELTAQQAVSFVRQRRDTGEDGPLLTDLDRSRRQQAFLVALADKLKQQSTLTDPKTVASLVNVTQTHVALDSEFDVLSFLRIAHQTAQRGAKFVILPIEEFDTVDGASVNIVDVAHIQSIVAAIFAGSYFDSPAGDEPAAAAEQQGAEAVAPESPESEPTRYESWDEPILAGSMPCVN